MKKKNKKRVENAIEPEAVVDTFAFDHTSVRILHALIKQIETNGYCTADHFHFHLGVLYKSAEVQKKSRNEFINQVNNVFRNQFKKEEDLILREKDIIDKRSFKYFISAENIQLVQGVKK